MDPIINSMRPSEISQLINDQHHDLKEKFIALMDAADALRAGGACAQTHAVALSLALCDQLSDHIAIEGTILVPALRNVDAWGKGRADHLIERLRIRRQAIESLRASCDPSHVLVLRWAINRFIDDRIAAMERAEVRDLRVLRDDVVGIDFNGG